MKNRYIGVVFSKAARVLFLTIALMATIISLEVEAQTATGSLTDANIAELGLQTSVFELSVKKVTLDYHQVSITKLLKYLEQKKNVQFSYDKELLASNPKVTVSLKNVPLDKALDEIFKNTAIEYFTFDGGYIVLRENKRKLAIETIEGTVTDAQTGETLPGVNILVKGTTTGTSSDAEGNYTLTVPSLQDTLIFSFIGYQTQEVPINGRTEINVSLQSQVLSGEEMVVVAYGEQEIGSVTGSISTISSRELEETPSITSGDALVGRVQGVTFRQRDARPGATVDVQIRNLGEPLFVIDGVPVSAAEFGQLGQGDIADITILKDASAAVYGLQAGAGAVLVQTKDGSYNSDTEINIDSYYGWQNYSRFPKPANAYQYIRGQIYAAQNRGLPLPYSEGELQNWKEGGDGYRSYDYYDIVMEPMVPRKSLKASISGGSESMSYYLSATHLDQSAIIEDYSFTRTNVQANIEGKVSDKIILGAQISARMEKRLNVGVPGLDDYFNPFLSVLTMWPTEAPYANDNPNYVNNTHNVNVNPATYTRDITGYVNDIWRGIRTNFNASYDFDFGLAISGIASYQLNAQDFNGFEYTYNAYNYDEENNEYIPVQGNENPWRRRDWAYNIDQFYQLQADYSIDLGKHSIDVLAAYERSKYNRVFQGIHTVPDNNYIRIMSFSNQDLLDHEIDKSARAGYAGRINYNYDDRYLIELLGRYDASYLYPPDERWGFFPGVSIGWRASEEEFFDDLFGDIISNLKLRVSYGRSGEETDLDAFAYRSGYDYYAGSWIMDGEYTTGVGPRDLPITSVSWVDNITKNVGIDISFFNDRLSATIDVFERRREGLPATREDLLLPDELGYDTPPTNLNSDAARGIEGQISYNGQIGQDISYQLGANATFSRWRQLEDYNYTAGNSWDYYRTSPENRYSAITWGHEVIGRFQSQEQIDNYPVNVDGQGNSTMLPGDFIYKDVNGDGIINGMDERPIGYAKGWNPYVSFGFNGNFYYKGVNLSFTFAGASMQTFQRNWEVRYFFQNGGNSPEYMLTDRWHRADPFDPTSEWIPGDYPANRGTNTRHSNYWSNTYWHHNITYLRLQNLTLAYSLPSDLLSRVGVNSLRVYAKGINLFSIDPMRKYQIDPEIASENALVYPRQSVYTVGFNLSL